VAATGGHPDRPSVIRKKASAPITSVPTMDVIPMLFFLLFLDTDHLYRSRRPSFGL
jgi:hypothetical protein